MAKVNVIWWGNPWDQQDADPDRSAELTANLLEAANKGPGEVAGALMGHSEHELIYWHEDTWTPPEGFNRKPLNLESLERGILRPLLANESWSRHIMPILATFQMRRAYSAFKDLLSLCLLYTQGGYFFDTSISVDEERLPALLSAQVDNIEAAATAGESPTGRIRVMARYLDTATRDLYLSLDPLAITGGVLGAKIPGVPHIEVSAMYAPPGEEAVLDMIKSYLMRCFHMRIDGDRDIWIAKGRPVLEPRDGSDMRKRVIGNIMITSVAYGLIEQARRDGAPDGDAREAKLKDYCWGAVPTERLRDEDSVIVTKFLVPPNVRTREPQYMPQLGIRKRSLQTWR